MPEKLQEMYAARDMQTITNIETAPNTAVIIFHVFAEEKPAKLDRSARLDVANPGNRYGVFLIVASHEDAVFTNMVPAKYDILATAVGYLPTHQEVNIMGPLTQHVDIVLHRDPAAVTLNPVSGLMSRGAKKEANRALSLLKSGQLARAQKHLETAHKLAPLNADLNFLLGYLYLEKRDYGQAATFLATASNLNPHSARTLTLLGRTNLLQKNYPAARAALRQAVLIDADEWLAHDLLADAYLYEKEYDKARDEARIAIAKSARYGKNASASAELVLGQALIGLGQKDEGIHALEAFVKQSPQSPMVYEVRGLITQVQNSDRMSSAGGDSMAAEIDTSRLDPLGAVPGPLLSMETWRPADIDNAKPTLAAGVRCPGTEVLAEAGKGVKELVQDVTRFAADEDLFHQALDGVGFSTHAETRKYNYVAAVSPKPGAVFIEEYRLDKVTQGGDPDDIGSTGFAMLALIFHPEMQGDFDFDCEGQGEWRGQPSWLVHFRQRHDRPNHMHGYSVRGQFFRVDLKGRAWISAGKFQILRIEADMVSPMHEIQLLSEHQTVEYGPVPFARKNTMLWLPKDAQIYFDFRKHHYYRRHSFDHYMLFEVDAVQKDKTQPSTPSAESSKEKNPS